MASSPQKSPSSPKSPTPKSPSSRKKDDSFLGKLGGTLARRKKAKEGKQLANQRATARAGYRFGCTLPSRVKKEIIESFNDIDTITDNWLQFSQSGINLHKLSTTDATNVVRVLKLSSYK